MIQAVTGTHIPIQYATVRSHHTRIAEIGQLGIWRKSITNTLSGSIQQKFKTLNLFFYRL